MEQAFDGIEGVHVLAEEMLITGTEINDHDADLETELNKAVEKNIKMNPNSRWTKAGYVQSRSRKSHDPSSKQKAT